MAELRKILGQAALSAASLVDVYEVPADTEAVISTVSFCNRTGAQVTFRLAYAPAGAANQNSQYVYYDYPLPPNETFGSTFGATLSAGDVVRAYASDAGISVSIFGVEIT